MAESDKCPAPDANIIWRRLASPRETMFGLRTDGTIRSICSNVEILSSVKIEPEVLEGCTKHFNRDMCCFREFLMEKEESKDIWLVKEEKNSYKVEELEKEFEIDKRVIEAEINSQLRAVDNPNWKLYCNYFGYDTSEGADSEKYPHVYQLIFVFCTGTLDEFSCALICDLFLNVLDCALKDVPLKFYSHLEMYDIGSQLEENTNIIINCIIDNKSHYEAQDRIYRKMLKPPCSTFNCTKKELENKNKKFRTMKCLFTRDNTEEFLNICKKRNIGVYAIFVAIINNVLFHHAVKHDFKGNFRTRVLHIVNSRFILNADDKKYTYKLGSHFLPYMQDFFFKSNSAEVEDILKEVPEVENRLDFITKADLFFDQEALRELYIKETGNKFNSGNWNPHYCFSVTNLGNLDVFYERETPKNSIRVLSYERASSAIEGGHLDVVFHIFRGKLNVHFDFSNEYFSDNEMLSITNLFSDFVETIIFKM